MRRIERRCAGEVESRDLALRRHGWAVERQVSPHGANGHMARRRQHHRQYILDQLPIRGGQEEVVRNELPLRLLVASLDGGQYALDTRAGSVPITCETLMHDMS